MVPLSWVVWPGAPDEGLLRDSLHGLPNPANPSGIADLDTWTEQAERFAAARPGTQPTLATGTGRVPVDEVRCPQEAALPAAARSNGARRAPRSVPGRPDT